MKETISYPMTTPKRRVANVSQFCGSHDDSMKFNSHRKSICWSKVFYMEHVLAYANHRHWTCGGPDVLTSAKNFKKCGGKSSSGGQESYILKTH